MVLTGDIELLFAVFDFLTVTFGIASLAGRFRTSTPSELNLLVIDCCCCMTDVVGFTFSTTFGLLAFCVVGAICRCALVCATIGVYCDFNCDVCVDTSIFG